MEEVREAVIERNQESFLFLYDEEEGKDDFANEENAKLVFTPEFIPYRLKIKEAFKLSHVETLIYGFIRFYKINSQNKFYFTNAQLGEVVGCSESTAEKAMANLIKKGLLRVGYRVKSGGGKIRFVNSLLAEIGNSEPPKTEVQNLQKRRINKNKINKNKINNTEREKETVFVPVKTGTSPSKTSFNWKEEYGEKYIRGFNELFGSNYRLTPSRKEKLKTRFKTYTTEEISKALVNLSESKFHQGHNDRNWRADPDFLIRNDEMVDKWLNCKGGDFNERC